MPVRINLLAEAQAAEEMRRRDPVKRALWAAGFLIAGMLLWSGWLHASAMRSRAAQGKYEQHWKEIEKDHQEVTAQLQRAAAVNARLDALYRLSTNRFLWAPALDAVQESMLEDKIQVTRIRGEHAYRVEDAVPARTSGGRTTPAKPAVARERITITIDARDFGNPAEANFDRFKERLSTHDYFSTAAQRRDGFVLFGVLGAQSRTADGREFIPFALQSRFPEVSRQ